MLEIKETKQTEEILPQDSMKAAIDKLVKKEELSPQLTKTIMHQIMSGQASPVQIASYLTAMRMKGETAGEISASAEVMRDFSNKVQTKTTALDIVGTGGDQAFTFNISTVSSFVIAAAGIPVAKHGNRSSSSKCGSADVLEELGVNIEASAQRSEAMLEEIGMCFMYAQKYHPSMKHAAPVRKEMGVRTIFNVLGPLANPANANMQLLGVYDVALVDTMAEVLNQLQMERALVFGGNDGLDEITLTTTSEVAELRDGKVTHFTFDPKDYGFEYCTNEDLVGGEPAENAAIALAILSGEKGPKRDTVLLNAGMAIYLANDDYTIADGIKHAAELIDSGAALGKLKQFITASQEATK